MISEARKQELLFPYEIVREEQNKLLLLTAATIENKRNLIVHAPTGLGKTAATLSPALKAAIDKDMTVLFLTSRHTQHKIAIETLKLIKEKFGADTSSVSIIGKKWMCLQPNVQDLSSGEFYEFCKEVVDKNVCMYYNNLKENRKEIEFNKFEYTSLELKVLNQPELFNNSRKKFTFGEKLILSDKELVAGSLVSLRVNSAVDERLIYFLKNYTIR